MTNIYIYIYIYICLYIYTNIYIYDESAQVSFGQENIDRTHRISIEYTDKNSGKKMKPIIVKFKSWRARNNSTMLDQKISKFVKRN